MITLQDFLERYKNDKTLRSEYGLCDKKALVTDFQSAQKEKENAPLQVKNISVSKRVYFKIANITAGVRSHYFSRMYFLPFLVPRT